MKLFAFERRWFETLLDTLIPTGGDERFPLSALDTDAMELFEEMLLYVPATTGIGLRASIWMFELAGPLLGLKRPRRFSRLDAARREQCLAVLSKSDIYLVRQMVTLIKMMACFGWGADPRVREALGVEKPAKFVTRSAEVKP